MRIVGGRWAGVVLTSPGSRVRPTREEVRDGWIGGLTNDLQGARVLDLFAGTGALGLEALSRGAASVDFVENGASALHALKANLGRVRVEKEARVFKKDVFRFLEEVPEGAYHVALADPPYTSRVPEALVKLWMDRPFSRILSVEHPAGRPLPGPGRRRLFGDTAVTTYRLSPAYSRR